MVAISLQGRPKLIMHPCQPDNWILIEEYRYTDADGNAQTIPRGFVTDFASIPRVLWNIISPMELGDTGPLEHDWEYRNGVGTRAKADGNLLRHMKEHGVSWWKRNTAYAGVRVGGWASWNSGKVVVEELQAA